jgi:transposase-like protein
MIAMQESTLPMNNLARVQPACPNCGRPMHLVRTAPRANGLADLNIFKCGECAVWLTESADQRGGA